MTTASRIAGSLKRSSGSAMCLRFILLLVAALLHPLDRAPVCGGDPGAGERRDGFGRQLWVAVRPDRVDRALEAGHGNGCRGGDLPGDLAEARVEALGRDNLLRQ